MVMTEQVGREPYLEGKAHLVFNSQVSCILFLRPFLVVFFFNPGHDLKAVCCSIPLFTPSHSSFFFFFHVSNYSL